MTRKVVKRFPPSQRRGAMSTTAPDVTANPAGAVDYAVCPLCGLNRVVNAPRRLKKGKPSQVGWNEAPSEEMPFIQGRVQHKAERGWVCRGFTRVPGTERTIAQALDDPVLHEVAAAMLRRVRELATAFKSIKLPPFAPRDDNV